MKQLLRGKPALTNKQRTQLIDRAIILCSSRNLTFDVMNKCVIARGYRELWLLLPDETPFRLI